MDLRPRQMRFIISKDIYKTLYIHDTLPIKFLPADFNGGFNNEFYSPEDDPQFGLLNWMTQTPNIKKVWMEPHKNRCFFCVFPGCPAIVTYPRLLLQDKIWPRTSGTKFGDFPYENDEWLGVGAQSPIGPRIFLPK